MAAPARRAALHLAADPDAEPPGDDGLLSTQPGKAVQDLSADAAVAGWEPEHQLVGALMHLSAARTRPILELVPDTAIWRPITRWAYQVIGDVVAAGHDPNPVTVLHTARHRPSGDALDPGRPPNPHQLHRFALYLFDAYSQTLTPAAAPDYARAVLEDAYRRVFGEQGIRMQQLAEAGAERDVIADQFVTIRETLADWWRRTELAAQPRWAAP